MFRNVAMAYCVKSTPGFGAKLDPGMAPGHRRLRRRRACDVLGLRQRVGAKNLNLTPLHSGFCISEQIKNICRSVSAHTQTYICIRTHAHTHTHTYIHTQGYVDAAIWRYMHYKKDNKKKRSPDQPFNRNLAPFVEGLMVSPFGDI